MYIVSVGSSTEIHIAIEAIEQNKLIFAIIEALISVDTPYPVE